MLDLEWANRRWRLHPQRGLLWVEKQTLIVTDTHFGKADHFRRAGVPVPMGSTRSTLDRIDAMLANTGAVRLIVLGDFFHASVAPDDHALVTLDDWLQRIGLPVVVVPGNHDRHGAAVTRQLPVTWTEEVLIEEGVTMRHHPPGDAAGLPGAIPPFADSGSGVGRQHKILPGVTLAGHLHPAVRLEGRARSSMRVPCFCFGPTLGLLPAVGAFTGLHPIKPTSNDRVFAIGDEQVIEVLAGPRRGAANEPSCAATTAAAPTAPRR